MNLWTGASLLALAKSIYYLVPKPCMFCEESLGLELFDRNSSVQQFYGLKALIPLEQVNTWVVEKKES